MADQWEVVEFPAIMPSGNHYGLSFGKSELLKVKASLSVGKWNAQWQPSSEETAMVKRDWWQEWEEDDVPDLAT